MSIAFSIFNPAPGGHRSTDRSGCVDRCRAGQPAARPAAAVAAASAASVTAAEATDGTGFDRVAPDGRPLDGARHVVRCHADRRHESGGCRCCCRSAARSADRRQERRNGEPDRVGRTDQRRQYDVVVDPGVTTLQQTFQQLFPGEDIRVAMNDESIILTGSVSSNAVMLRAGEIARGHVEQDQA